MSTTTAATTLQESVNIILANQGESPVNSITGTVPQQVSLALNTLEEVSSDIQSKGWWYNQSSAYAGSGGAASGTYAVTNNITIFPSNPSNAGSWHVAIPEQARRYITIRAARIMQSRMISSEELQKFSYQEELVSLAILQQAHVRNSGGVLDFTSFPTELKGLGIDEVMFLQGNIEEKIGTIKLTTDLANKAKIEAETNLLASQKSSVEADVTIKGAQATKIGSETSAIQTDTILKSQQALTELKETAKREAEKLLLESQATKVDEDVKLVTEQVETEKIETGKRTSEKGLIDAQKLKVDAEELLTDAQTTKTTAETGVVGAQKTLLERQADTEFETKLKIYAETGLTFQQQAKVDEETKLITAQELDVKKDTEVKEQQKELLGAQKGKTDEEKAKVIAEASLIAEQELKLAEDKALTVAQKTKVQGETNLISSQKSNVEADTTLKGSQDTKIGAETSSIQTSTILTSQQALTELKETAKREAEKELILEQKDKVAEEADLLIAQELLVGHQKDELSEKRAYDSTAEKSWFENGGVGLSGESGFYSYKDFRAELRIMGIQETAFNALPASKKVELIKDAHAMRTQRTSGVNETGATNLNILNAILRLIGETKVSNVNQNSIACAAYELMLDTNEELQSRGWWFNTTQNYAFTATSAGILSTQNVSPEVLNVEINNVNTRKDFDNSNYIYDLDKQSYTDWSGTVKGTIIQRVSLASVPVKYRQYLEVRVAIILTEMYPQSGIDIQRLPKMEAELQTYFKDRENNNANYNVFDNSDTANRIGINRNYSIL